MTLAVVTIVHGRHSHLLRQRRSLARSVRVPDLWVVVSMGDPGVVGVLRDTRDDLRVEVVELPCRRDRLPLAAARNRGAEVARARGATALVFLDVDCLVSPELTAAYEVAAVEDATIWSGPVTYLPPGLDEEQLASAWLWDDPHPARPAPAPGEVVRGASPELFWSLSFALSASAWHRSGGFHEAYAGYGGEDTDFALQATARGLQLAWLGSARAYHQHHPVEGLRPERVEDILRNGRVFSRRWGWWPMVGWLEELEGLGAVRRVAGGWERAPRPAGQ